ncbi:transcriptional regulator, LuxR family/hydrolase, alpha/beta fold family protein [Roseobacter sp. SK209-2-6]|nr:transcriptional regulator, LuxR family/hydrolase, alpha/beta fold family protein [Roseobacter sp. SK209-2-6]
MSCVRLVGKEGTGMKARQRSVPSREQVVAAIYETVLRPELFDRFGGRQIAEWTQEMPATPWGWNPVFEAPELQAHFARALEILEQEWNQQGQPTLLSLPSSNPAIGGMAAEGCWAVFAPDGTLLRHSGSFGPVVQLKQGLAQDALGALGVSAQGMQIWRDLLYRVRQKSEGWQQIRAAGTIDPGRLLMCRPIMTGAGDMPIAVVVEVLDFASGPTISKFLQETFSLEGGELQCLEDFFCNGTSLQEGGGQLEQLLAIVARTGAPGLAEFARLVSFLTWEYKTDQEIAEGRRLPPQSLLEHDGRVTQVFRLGADTGQPVIFAHGIMDGLAGLQRMQPELRRAGFRVYAPMRGGYGASSPAPKDGEQLQAFIDQVHALIETENLQRPILMGHRSGAIFIRAAALQLRDRIGGVLGVAPAAAFHKFRLYGMLRGHQRSLALAAQFAPKLMPVVLKSWSRSVQRRGGATLMRRQISRGSQILPRLNQLDLDRVLTQSHSLTMQQDGSGVTVDLKLLTRDWRPEVRGAISQAIFLCGEGEAMDALDGLFSRMGERAQMRFCEGLGAVMLYLAPELVLSALEELALPQKKPFPTSITPNAPTDASSALVSKPL